MVTGPNPESKEDGRKGNAPGFPSVDFNVERKRFDDVLNPTLSCLYALEESHFNVLLHALLLWIQTSYQATVLLVSDNEKGMYAQDAWTLVRSMFESYFTLLFVIQKPAEHSRWHWQAALGELDSENDLDIRLSKCEPEDSVRIYERKGIRGMLAQAADISQAQLCGAVPMPPKWPSTPGHMLNVKTPDLHWLPETRKQARLLYEILYPMLSRKSHPTWDAIGSRVAAKESRSVNRPSPSIERAKSLESAEPLLHAWLVLSMALTEVNAVALKGRYTRELEEVWAFLQKMRPRFRCYYEIRYEGLLHDQAVRCLTHSPAIPRIQP